ncbi:MAG: DUF309 domain-containing protein [Sphingomonadales bacterium]
MTRFLPDEPFPAYAFTPGRNPHPVRHPDGHSYGAEPSAPSPPDPDDWRASHDYLRGIDLFNAGYYWEAHEAWEGLWNVSGRAGAIALLLQALIALAAAGLKLRVHNELGTTAHSRRADWLLEDAIREAGPRQMGLDLMELQEKARGIQEMEPAAPPAVLGFELNPA